MNPPRIPLNPSMIPEERPETKQMADLKGSIPVAATCYPTSNESTLKTRLQSMKSYRFQLKMGLKRRSSFVQQSSCFTLAISVVGVDGVEEVANDGSVADGSF